MITHDYNLIFIHIPKCAGRSISEVFNQRFDQYTSTYYTMEYGYFWRKYRKFTIVRNPYDRLVSIYNYIQQHRRHRFEPIACNGAPFPEWVQLNFDRFKRPFNPLSPEAERGTDWMLGSPHWFSPQARFIDYGVGIDKIFKFEDGMDQVQEYIRNAGFATVLIPHVNKSNHDHWKNHYSRELLKYINTFDFITLDCNTFGYTIE